MASLGRLVQCRLVGCLADRELNRSSFKVVWIHEGGTSRK